ncbi:nuclear pore complex protein Nup98-Nup96-like [Zerene cesonia]|uniref:nuclear pore complex protein Nup98-Nup96-like n=1 Tax=Zerene cesonia TaxID=33412 RepID=UPI0018E59D64|nr:nuclear pore complex protein Nup98-Nup96-like [Zerene cesonia]
MSNAAMCELDRYVRGRADDDWSEAVVARLQLGKAECNAVQDLLSRQLASLLEFSTSDADTARPVARLVVRQSPADRKRLLDTLLADAESAEEFDSTFGVSSAFCVEVWKLCEALWGDDLLNDGIPGTDEQSVVSRHANLLAWLKDAVAKSTDRELAASNAVPDDDDKDGHSEKVWTLFVGGRILEACKLCKEHGDLNMAALIAQASGDPLFRSLVARQLRAWRECGAEALVGGARAALLALLGARAPRDRLAALDWPRALHVCARYLCPQIPTLERVVRKYESFFGADGVDLATVAGETLDMRLPAPDYCDRYSVSVDTCTEDRRQVVVVFV